MSQSSSPPPRQRISSEPWLPIHNLACLTRAYEEGVRERSLQEDGQKEALRRDNGRKKDEEEKKQSLFHQSMVEERREGKVQRKDNRYGGENYNRCLEDFSLKVSHSVLSPTEMSSTPATLNNVVLKRCLTPAGLPTCLPPHSQVRRNTLPFVTVDAPLLHFPPLVSQSSSHLQVPTQVSPSKRRTMVFLPHPPSSCPPSKASARPGLPPLPLASSVTSLDAPSASCCTERNGGSLRRHSVQLE